MDAYGTSWTQMQVFLSMNKDFMKTKTKWIGLECESEVWTQRQHTEQAQLWT